MTAPHDAGLASVTEPVKAEAQTPGTGIDEVVPQPGRRGPQAGREVSRQFRVARAVEEEALTKPYERRPDDPVYRPLRIYSLDPVEGRVLGKLATVKIPYEPLRPDELVGELFEVDPKDHENGRVYAPALLNASKVLLEDGYEPSPSEPRFHQQMVYAVCTAVYSAFRAALGRVISWSFPSRTPGDSQRRLLLRPFGMKGENAFYDKTEGVLIFGYFDTRTDVRPPHLPGGFVHTSLSHDVIAHEVTHALLDGLRSRFDVPSGPDVPAFHEGFADIVAILQHFSYSEVLRAALRESRGELRRSRLLWDLATQFGQATGRSTALRTGLDTESGYGKPRLYDPSIEQHDLGSVLVSGVFEAFTRIYALKVERYIRAATGGSGVLPEGEVQADLQGILAEEAAQLAAQFLKMCIRAIDYCPPVDVEFGEFLRAVITADRDLVPDDPWGYRDAWIEAFGRRRVFPRLVPNLSVDALLWRPPPIGVARVDGLSFADLRFSGDPGRPAGAAELRRQACVLGEFVSRPENLEAFGFVADGDRRLKGDRVSVPEVQSIRSSRRIGPDGQVVFDLVAEVLQTRTSHDTVTGREFDFFGGATVILGPDAEVRYIIGKSVANEQRVREQQSFMAGAGRAHWGPSGNRWAPRPHLFRRLHQAHPVTPIPSGSPEA